VLETMVDQLPMAVAHANPSTGQIEFKATWCGHLDDYLDDPKNAKGETLWALHVFTHEVMHIRGERNEQVTDCQAYQRNVTIDPITYSQPGVLGLALLRSVQDHAMLSVAARLGAVIQLKGLRGSAGRVDAHGHRQSRRRSPHRRGA